MDSLIKFHGKSAEELKDLAVVGDYHIDLFDLHKLVKSQPPSFIPTLDLKAWRKMAAKLGFPKATKDHGRMLKRVWRRYLA